MQDRDIARVEICAKRLGAAAHVADAHGACVGVAAHLSEGLHLHGAHKGNDGVGESINRLRQKADGEKQEPKGKIVIATVKGDIHDIGKNIVKVLLENYGFDVIDLGKDVDPELVVETAKREQVKLVGLSALMTTTVANMEITIKRLHEDYPECKIMVGGAVLTQDYADRIGADFYSKDAMGSVRYAERLFTEI